MARIYIDTDGDGDEDFPGQCALYQANCDRSVHGKQGQKSLRELEQALLALPDKRLIADELETQEGEVCAIGALKRFKGIEHVQHDPEVDMDMIGVELGMPRLVAWSVVALNDHEYDYMTPEQRYTAMLNWVQHQLRPSV